VEYEGTIGTALFVQIGVSLSKGGPGKLLLDIYAPAVRCFLILNLGSLFFAFTLWCTFILAVNNCLCEIDADPRSNAQIDALSSGDGLVDPYIFTICTRFAPFSDLPLNRHRRSASPIVLSILLLDFALELIISSLRQPLFLLKSPRST